MSLRWYSLAVVTLALIACRQYAQTAGDQLPPDPVLDIFEGREVRGHTVAKGGESALNLRIGRSPLFQPFSETDWRRSLVISDCASGQSWCQDPAFGFGRIFETARNAIHKQNRTTPDADSLAQGWFDSAAKQPYFESQVPAWTGLANSAKTFQTLAVVNRLDLAQWNGEVWQKGEIRFVYGLTPAGGGGVKRVTLIMEFVLPPFRWEDFSRLASEWKGLAKSTNYSADLQAALRDSRIGDAYRIRLRTNRETVEGWVISQWQIQPKPQFSKTPSFEESTMDDQIRASYITALPASQGYAGYIGLWKRVTGMVAPKSYPIPDNMLQRSYRMVPLVSEDGMPTPVNYCGPSDTVRRLISLQQCAYCHTSETGTDFVQIGNRAAGKDAPLAAFLTGDNSSASLLDLYLGSSAHQVQVDFDTYGPDGAGGCTKKTRGSSNRKFADIARRALFLDAMEFYKTYSRQGLASIEKFSTNFTD